MALQKRPMASDLMPPPPPPKRARRAPTVLAEEVYVAAIEYIVKRDFFPALHQNSVQDEYLDARRSGDREWMDEAGRRVQEAMTPRPQSRHARMSATPSATPQRSRAGSATPVGAGGDTPLRNSTPLRAQSSWATDFRELDMSGVDLNLRLDQFNARYTSEDSASFSNLLDKDNAKRRQKYAWVWNYNTAPSKQQLAQAAVIEKHERRRLVSNSQVSGGTGEALIRIDPDASSMTESRPAVLNYKRKPYEPRNALMFHPEDLESQHPQFQSRAQLAADASRAGAKSIDLANTRLSSDPLAETGTTSVMPSPALSAVDAVLSGIPHPSLMPGGRLAESVASSDAGGGETPRVHGYAYVDSDPTEEELSAMRQFRSKGAGGDLGPVDHEAIMKAIKQSSGLGDDEEAKAGPTSGFTLAPLNERDELLDRLVEKNSAFKRSSSVAPRRDRLSESMTPNGSSSTPRTPKNAAEKRADRLGSMTPATRKLYENIRSSGSGGGSSAFDVAAGNRAWSTPVGIRNTKKK